MSAAADPVTVRRAVPADVPFIARIETIASTPPFPESLWLPLVRPTGTPLQAFLEALHGEDVSAWGTVADTIVLEEEGRPVASCAVFEPSTDPGADQRPMRLDRLPRLAARLGWSDAVTADFRAGYEGAWGPGDQPHLRPQAPVIVETVGVVPEARGRGLGRRLIAAALDEARRRGHRTAGIMAVIGNDVAHRLYRAMGFRPVSTYHAAFFDDTFPGVVRYRASLS